ncbi:MAG: dihydropteroate synthase [Bdellovibrionia bacterium]
MVVLGLGSNCGDRLEYLRDAIHRIQYETLEFKGQGVLDGIEVTAISPLYESDALLPPGAPKDWDLPFLNINILCKTNLSPPALLKFIKDIEAQIGRKDRGRWAPREIDIDILVMGDLNYKNESLQIPHPGLLERPFAILPLVDLLPNWIIPIPGQHQGMPVGHYVSSWKRNWESMPFRTRRSPLGFTELMGILNITPDSFSDGGLHNTTEPALRQIQELIHNGINIIDIGGESTRPGARLLETEEEWSRIQPLLQAVQGQKVRLSVDTRNPEIASRSIQLGVDWINDVSGFASDAMKEAVVGSHPDSKGEEKWVKLVVMHSLSVPPKKSEVLSPNEDLIDQLVDWAETRIQSLKQFGIERSRIIFDPGLGFGKTPQQSWEILRRAHEFHKLKVPILFGHSRKSFLSTLTDKHPRDRDIETTVISVELAKKGISYLRVHNGEQNARGLKTWSQVDGVCRW